MIPARYISLMLTLLMTVGIAGAQSREQREDDSDEVTIGLITCAPGPEVYEVYGHTALRVVTPDYDAILNYGTFDFNEPNFLYRFIAGDADYMLEACPTDYFLPYYKARGSMVWEQRLNLTSQQKDELLRLVRHNLRPENVHYHYSFIFDNCATRPRDLLEAAVPSLTWGSDTAATAPTFREIIHHYVAHYAWLLFGIDLALGWDVDKPIDARQQMFAPLYLKRYTQAAHYTDSLGREVPLVAAPPEVVVNVGTTDGVVEAPTPWYAHPLTVAIALLLIVAAVSYRDLRRHRLSRWLDTVLFVLYALGGCIIAFLVVVSSHPATTRNLVAVWLTPLYLYPLVAIWLKRGKRGLRLWAACHGIAIALLLVLSPLLPQYVNPAFVPLMLIPILRYYIIYNHYK